MQDNQKFIKSTAYNDCFNNNEPFHYYTLIVTICQEKLKMIDDRYNR